MDFPSQDPEPSAPASRALAGPSRTKSDARRQARTSSLKPYARPPPPSLPTSSSSSSSANIIRSSSSSSNAALANSLKSDEKDQGRRGSNRGGGGGLFSSLRQAIFSRPLSWLQGGASQSDTGDLNRSSSSSSLPSTEQREAATRLAARHQATDPEAHRTSLPSSLTQGQPAPQARLATTPDRFNVRAANRPWQARSAGDAVRSGRSPSPAAMSSTSGSVRQRVSLGAGAGGAAGSSAGGLFGTPPSLTPGYRRTGSLRREGSVGAPPSISASQSHTPALSYGFGSERRYTQLSSSGSAYGSMTPSKTVPSNTASSSHYRLPSRSPLARPGQRGSVGPGAGYAASEAGASPLARSAGLYAGGSRPGSVYGGSLLGGPRQSVAGSVAGSNASMTPRRKQWSSLKLGPQRMEPSEGEELMREYASMRERQGLQTAGQGPGSSRAGSVMDGVDDFMRPLKREAAAMSMDLDDDAMSSASGRKRQKRFVWDSDMGFVSRDEQRARQQPPRPIAQNEAERILNVLESMRTPLGDARRDASARSSMTPSRHMAAVPVPLPVAERSMRERDAASKTLAPYSRTIKQNRLSTSLASAEAPEGMRARLRRSAPAAAIPKRESATRKKREEDAMSESSDRQVSDEGDQMDDEDGNEVEEEKEEEEEIVEPPRRTSARNAVKTKQQSQGVGKATPDASGRSLRPTNKVDAKPAENPASKAMSKARPRFSVNGASAARRDRETNVDDSSSTTAATKESQKASQSLFGTGATSASASTPSKDNFSIRSGSDTGSSRGRSSLRQGAEKTSRQHGKSGRISAWDMEDDDDEDDGLPGSEDLSKIKLPPTMFPKGFSFGASSSTSTASTSTPVTSSDSAFKASSTATQKDGETRESKDETKALPAPQDVTEKKEPKSAEPADKEPPSLLSRLGGFAPPAPSDSTTPKKDPPPTFSFSAPSTSDNKEAKAPLFSTSVATSKSEAKSPFSFAPAKPAATTSSMSSDFFKAGPASLSLTPSPSTEPAAAKQDGPIPNFFASSLARSDAPSSGGAEAQARPSSNGSASGSSHPDKAASAGGEKKNAPFSFGTPSSSSPAATHEPKAPMTFSFGQPSSSSSNPSASTSTPSFAGFGNGRSSAKRGAEDDSEGAEEPGAKKTASPFGGGINFGQPASSASSEKPSQPSSFTFGAPASDKGKPAVSAAPAATPSAAFSFGQPPKPAEGGDSTKKVPTPAFSFGATASQPKSGETSSKEASPAPSSGESGGLFSTPVQHEAPKPFSFGQPASNGNAFGGGASRNDMMDSAPSGFGTAKSSAAPANNSSGGFSFGAPVSSAAPVTSAPSAPTSVSSPFSFGVAGSSNPPSNPFGGSATTSSQPQTPAFGAGSGTGSDNKGGGSGFSFGQQPSNNSGANGSGFGTPASSSPFAFGAKTGGFGAGTTPTTSQPSTPGFAFGAADASRPGTPSSAPQSGFSFGSQPQQQQQSSTPGGSGFTFSMQPSNSSSGVSQGGFGAGGGAGGQSSPAPFVFGQQPGQPLQPQQQPGSSGGFSFGANASPAPQTPPPASPAGGTLFNLGAPPSAGSNASGGAGGNRVVRSMPKRGPRRG